MSSAGGLALGGLFVAIWASAFTSASFVVREWPPFWALAIRFACTAVLLLAIVAARRAPLPGPRDAGRVLAMGLLGTGGYLACAWWAMATVPSGLVALISAAVPLFVALGEALLFRRPPRGLAWLGLGLGWAGVALLGGLRAAGGLSGAEAGGLALALLGAVSQAAGLLAFAPARGRVDAWTAHAGQCAAAALLLLVLALWREGAPPVAISAPALAGLLWSALVVGIAGYALYFVMLRRLPASTAAALQLLAPPLAAVFGWALLSERLAWSDVLGGVITLSGLALLLRARSAG
jgi:drug/metabolite transporter (DMT)-like permease